MKIKYDVSKSDAEKAVGGDFEQPKPGVYTAKVVSITDTHPKDQKTGRPDKKRHMLEIVYEVVDKKFKGSRVWDYIVDYTDPESASIWKWDQFLQAFGYASKKKRKGTFDTDDVVGERCKIRIKGDSYDGEYRAKIGAVLAIGDDEDEEIDDDEMDDDDELEDDELEDEDDDIEEGDDDDLDDDDDDEEILDDDDDEEEEEDEDDDSDYLTEDDLRAMDKDDLKATAKDFDVSIKGKKKGAIIEEILEAQAAPGDEGYDDWDVEQLKAELKERGLKVGGKKKELIARLEEDDEEDPF